MTRSKGRPAHRPHTLNESVAATIINALRQGNYQKTACEFAGISYSTFNQWKLRGELEIDRVNALDAPGEQLVIGAETYEKDDDGRKSTAVRTLAEFFNARPDPFSEEEWPFVVFYHSVTKSKASSEMRALGVIQQAFPDSWQAAAWYLERTRPDKYSRRDRLALEGGKGEGSPIEHAIISVDELDTRLDELMSKRDDDSRD